ncbi:hypothetical protein [Rubritalea marina]|uniref:hypothetical protein n=1 Tax=Rubritalea marina TaxID=361055 RepID=UPI00052603EE|nr:hypothetical protein [Rubritalea marina]
MKYIYPFIRSSICASFLVVLSSCAQQTDELPPVSSIKSNLAEEGTLTNKVLERDATQAIRKLKGGNPQIIKFVLQQPVGASGNKAWREIWVTDPHGKSESFIMTFREDGRGSANFEIEPMRRS